MKTIELTRQELTEINGGILPAFIAGYIIGYTVVSSITKAIKNNT